MKKHLMLRSSFFLLIFIVLWGQNLEAKTKSLKIKDQLKNTGLDNEECIHFVDFDAVELQKKQWSALLHTLEKKEVLLWISGQKGPPQSVKTKVRKQFRCLLRSLTEDAAESKSELLIQSGVRKPASWYKMKGLQKGIRTQKGISTLEKKVVRSFYRKAAVQASIWRRKFRFSGKNFNIISLSSAMKCKLSVGDTWKPKKKKHRQCWGEMTSDEKEKEILLASSAPGISRHHWGSDIDVFSLNPRTFRKGQKNFDEYQWLNKHGLEFGFFQPYSSQRESEGLKLGYMNERWHWSYYPIGGALTDFAKENQAELGGLLNAQWDRYEMKRPKLKQFSFIRQYWRSFMFNVSRPRD